MKCIFKYLFIGLITFLFTGKPELYSQEYKRANIWYFGNEAGVDFSTGEPVVLYDGRINTGGTSRGSTAMCNTNGNLLYYSHGMSIYNKNHLPMDNSFMPASYDVISFPVYGSDHEYFVFSAPNFSDIGPLDRFYYAVVDMNLNGGLGNVGQPIKLLEAWDPDEKLTATRHKNKRDVWVIVRKLTDEKYAAFFVSEDSVYTQAVLSPAPAFIENIGMGLSRDQEGQIKVSLDKKYIINSYIGNVYITDTNDRIEACKFNAETGEIDYLYSFQIRDLSLSDRVFLTFGVEFSPDSKYLYLSGHLDGTDSGYVYQLDMQHIEDSASFLQSKILVGQDKRFYGMQLARDGKIYITARHMGLNATPYLSVIHDPWKNGIACNFEAQAVDLSPKESVGKLTNILPDFLYRFDFDGVCEGEPFAFDPWFVPDPIFIEWNFGDPASGANNTSTIPNATHEFSDGGEYEVSVYVEYPNGRIEETSRIIEVEYKPEPDLGSDTSICNGGDIELNAECGPHIYSWSTGAFGSSQIIVSDSGWYWVRVENDFGCFEIDSLHISFHNTAFADTSNLLISPTTCGGSQGAIRGIMIQGVQPLTYQWLDDLGNPISTSLDIFHLPVGNYSLVVTDGNDCINTFGPYSIIDAGDVLIESVDHSQEHCNQQDASIIINAASGLGDMLFYSIDNGTTYFNNQGVFTGLSAGNYAVRVRDSSNCQDVYISNPIIIQNIDAPEIIDVQIGDCESGQNNGSIEIGALGAGDTLLYSNDNGLNFQINDGGFFNLAAGFYTCVVMDESGCDTTFMVEVPEVISIHIQAVAGADEVCPGNAAFVPLFVSNFNDVTNFKTTLLYDKDLLICTGYANPHAQLEDSLDATMFPAAGKVELSWHSASLSLPDNTSMATLVFESLESGVSMVDWDGSAGACQFQNSSGLNIPVDYFLDSVRIYQEVAFSLGPDIEVCEGDDIELVPMLLSSNGDVTYLWTDPSGANIPQDTLRINNSQENQSGTYSLRTTDTLDCYADESINLLIHPLPVPAFSGQDTIITEEPLELDAGDNFNSYLWNTGETNQYITAEEEDWFSVMIESIYGCLDEDSVYVLFIETPVEPIFDQLYLPNAFTPDGDGLNDVFEVAGYPDNISSFQMYIFNRWGQMLFESNDISYGWDGKIKGEDAPAGTYVYKIICSVGIYDFNKTATMVLVR